MSDEIDRNIDIGRLAITMKGMPKDSLVLIETPDGLKPLRSIHGGYGQSCDGLPVEELRAAQQDGTQYVIILSVDP
jgi:hypothetical protein